MLVLSRKKDEGIVFDGPGRVVVVGVRGGVVRLGFEAARAVRVCRDELIARDRNAARQEEAGNP